MLQRIEERINILTVNTELESDWDELRELGNQYRALEQRIKNKMETWNKLRASDQINR
jgi:flagellar motility protein MotE (MotC chaperone)